MKTRFAKLVKVVYGIITKEEKKMVGCDFLSNTIKSITTNTLINSIDYPVFKESIDRVYEIMNN